MSFSLDSQISPREAFKIYETMSCPREAQCLLKSSSSPHNHLTCSTASANCCTFAKGFSKEFFFIRQYGNCECLFPLKTPVGHSFLLCHKLIHKLIIIFQKSSLPFLALLIISTCAQQQQQQPEFRQNNQEPQFAPPPQVAPISAQFGSFQQTQQQPIQPGVGQGRQNVQFPQSAQPQQQQQQQFNFPQSAQPSQQQSFQQPNNNNNQPQANFNDFAAFNNRQQSQEALPTLPPVFIPPNSPQGPPPQLQSPIRNLFRQPSDNNFSLSNIISRFLNLFNLNNN